MARDFAKMRSNNIIKGLSDKGIEESNKTISKDVPLDLIRENALNEVIFKRADDESINELIEIIKKNGFDDPVGLYELPDGTYEIYSGHRRYLAIKKMGKKTIPAVIRPYDKDEITRFSRLAASNLGAEAVTTMQKARIIKECDNLLRNNGFKGNKRAKIVEIIGCGFTESNITKYLAIFEAIPELQEKVEKDIIAYSAIYDIICNKSKFLLTEDEQRELNNEIDNFLASQDKERGHTKCSRPWLMNTAEKIYERRVKAQELEGDIDTASESLRSEREEDVVASAPIPDAFSKNPLKQTAEEAGEESNSLTSNEIAKTTKASSKIKARNPVVKSITDYSLSVISVLDGVDNIEDPEDINRLLTILDKLEDTVKKKKLYLKENMLK